MKLRSLGLKNTGELIMNKLVLEVEEISSVIKTTVELWKTSISDVIYKEMDGGISYVKLSMHSGSSFIMVLKGGGFIPSLGYHLDVKNWSLLMQWLETKI